jgi:hypothetical protein
VLRSAGQIHVFTHLQGCLFVSLTPDAARELALKLASVVDPDELDGGTPARLVIPKPRPTPQFDFPHVEDSLYAAGWHVAPSLN